MATIIAYGSDILNNVSISSDSSAGNNGAGEITLIANDDSYYEGYQVFDDDYIVVFEISDDYVDEDGELTGEGGFSSITVYASVEDYNSGTVLYSYEPQNEGQVATIQNSLDGFGDTYFTLNASVLVSSDPDAPSLTSLFVSPGSDIANATSTVTIDHETDLDYDGDGTIDAVGNGQFSVESSVTLCFAEGTRILCANGERNVEDLRKGDLITTIDHGLQPILWIGCTRYNKLKLLENAKRCPIELSAGAGAGGELEKIRVTRQHRVLDARGFLVKAIDLVRVPKCKARIAKGVKKVTYYHVLLPNHELIFSNGIATESFYPGKEAMKSIGETARASIVKLFPKLATELAETAYGPMARPVAKLRDLNKEWRPVFLQDVTPSKIDEAL